MDYKEQVQDRILLQLKDGKEVNTITLHKELRECMDICHDDIIGVCKSLEARGYIRSTNQFVTYIDIKPEGTQIVNKGISPEMELIELIQKNSNGIPLTELKKNYPSYISAEGLKNAQANKYTKIDGGNVVLLSSPNSDIIFNILKHITGDECTEDALLSVIDMGIDKLNTQIATLKRRKLINLRKIAYQIIVKGENFSSEIHEYSTDITQSMILDESADSILLKPMNLHAGGTPVKSGSVHPLMAVQKKFKKILMGMGFEEMPTDQWVENSFWNFDALFQPQQHPARDCHDTFFLKSPEYSNISEIPSDYMARVKETHINGGDTGSIGWRYPFDDNEALKNILRTHTTACSSKMLYQMGEEYRRTGKLTPKKYYSIDRVFRNETVDATHLAEFHQVEGFIADYDISLCDLISVLKEFYKQIGITNLRFKPAYNPYTEPSMEIFGYHNTKHVWMEVGNSGIFRPEMLQPMGLPPNVNVIAWGLSLERPTMIRHNIKHIRDLFGSKSVIGI